MDSLESRLQRRKNRRSDFAVFSRFATSQFEGIAARDRRAAHFKALNGLCIVPGGRLGGQDDRLFEVFFGARPFDAINRITVQDGRSNRVTTFVSEFGATLHYCRQDDDTAVVVLFSAGTREDQTSGPNIVLDVIRDPRVLTGVTKLEMHWRYLMAMMETTSIDGNPTWQDRLLMTWLRITKYEIKDNKTDRIRMWVWLGVGAGFVFSVGFAGWMIELVKWAMELLKNV